MLPSQPQATGKRKPEDFNPLLNAVAAKKAKKEAKLGASSKRKLNRDDGAGGLLIVRAPESQPSHSQPIPAHTTDSQPPRFASQPAGPSKPTSKKFKSDAQVKPNSKSKTTARDRVAYSGEVNDSEVENDVRAMEDEADSLRRKSRAITTINSSLLTGEANIHFPSRSAEPPNTSRSRSKSRVVDIMTPLPDNENKQLERNKQLRQGAMDAITGGGRGRTMDTGDSSRGHRRKSSVGRGKRTSTAFETTGVITQPHNSVSESSFYKHIDSDLPEPERVRQLLIWCSLRGAAGPPSIATSKTSPSLSLPPLSSQASQTLKIVQDHLVRMLAEKRMNLSLYSPEASSSRQTQEDLGENEQNVRNRQLEGTYSEHIQQAHAEEEVWKKISYGYDAYAKKLQSSLEKRAADLDPTTMSAKAKGKRRATGDIDDLESHFMPQEHELPSDFHLALALAKSVLVQRLTGDNRIPGRRSISRSDLTREEMESELKRRLPSLEYKIDQIFSFANAARTTTNLAERALNERFDIISANLSSRLNPFPPASGTGAAGSTTQLLTTYVAHPSGAKASSKAADPKDLFKALSRVDQERPPAQVGDAARRAAREVQRANENGVSAVGDRKLTVPSTPRKAPGTPRRGTTPSRDR